MAKRLIQATYKIKSFFKKDFKVLFPQLYLVFILIGFVFTLLYAAFPSLMVCSNIFGEEFCTPLGVFISLIVSFPGYFIAGNILSFFPTLAWFISLIIVFVTSIASYYLLGRFFDKLRKTDSEKRLNILIVAIFILLLFMAIVLL